MIGTEYAVTPETIVSEAMKMKTNGYRLMSMTCNQVEGDDAYIIYHFDRSLEIVHLRMDIKLNKPVPSISGVYFAAILGENEMRDQFALVFDGLVLDFNRTLLLDEEVAQVPLVNNVKIVDKK